MHDRTPPFSAAVGLSLTAATLLIALPLRAQHAVVDPDVDVDAGSEEAYEDNYADDWQVVDSADAYVVEAEAPVVPPPGVDVGLAPGPYASDLAQQIDAAPGARAVRSGVELAPDELRVRGLGGPRLAITLDGIPLDDPAGGKVDLTELESELLGDARLLRGPEAGTLAPGALAGTLALRSAPIEQGLHAGLRTVVGSEETARSSARLSFAEGPAAVSAALQLGRSGGEFGYRPVSYSGDQPWVGEREARLNNDHARYGATLLGRWASEQLWTQGLVLLSRHDGGVAGLAGHPTPEARAASERAVAGIKSGYDLTWGVMELELSARRRESHFVNPMALAPIESHEQITTSRGAASLEVPGLLGALDLALAIEASQSEATPVLGDVHFALDSGAATGGLEAERRTLAGHARLRLELLRRRLAVDGGLRLDSISDVGTEPSISARLSAALTRGLSLEAYGGRAFRAPTFYEKYGPPLGYTRANPDLRAEDGVEAGAALRYQRPGLMVEGSLFAARLSHAILYLNRNAYEVRPENTGSLWRAGGEINATLRATSFVQQSGGVELLLSRLDATGAPVPTSPLLRLRSRTELVLAALWPALPVRAYLDGRAQSQSASNYHGELTVPAQASLDAGLAYSFAAGSSLALELRNLLDSDSRVDMHQVPLPGRQLMASLVLGV